MTNQNAATPLHDTDFNDDDAVVDGTNGDSANEDKKPTLQERLESQDFSLLEKEALKAVNAIKDLEGQAATINHKKAEIRERMESMGINRHALAAAVRVSKMDEDKLDGFDLSTIILRRAIGNPIQSDLFDS